MGIPESVRMWRVNVTGAAGEKVIDVAAPDRSAALEAARQEYQRRYGCPGIQLSVVEI